MVRSSPGLGGTSRLAPRQRRSVAPWVAVLAQTARDLWANHAMEWAAAIAFFALICFLPLLLAATALATYLVDAAWAIAWFTTLIEAVVPAAVIDTEPIVTMALAQQGTIGIIGILAWLFGGRRILGVLISAMNLVSDVDEQRETVGRRLLVELALLIGLGALLVLTLLAGPRIAPAGSVAASVMAVLVLMLGFTVLYSVVPLGIRGKRAVLIGAGAATLLLLVGRVLFLALLDWIWGAVSLIYGPLAVSVVLLLWGWSVGLVVLFGGSLASHVKVMLEEGKSAREASRRHVPETRAD